MYIEFNKENYDYLIKLFEQREIIDNINEYLIAPIEKGIRFNELDINEEDIDNFDKKMKANNITYTKDQLHAGLVILNSLDSNMLRDIEFKHLHQIIKQSHIFKQGELELNPYYKNIHFENMKLGSHQLNHHNYKKYEPFIYACPSLINQIEYPYIGFFDHDFSYPCIMENNQTWMSVTPNEIYTMKENIEEATGNVLTIGLGMGYYAYMVSIKEEVNSVTIIEYNQEVIDLFERVILPQFPNKNKIHIIKGDGINYLKNHPNDYDYCFVDIWMNTDDILPYLKIKQISVNYPITYWIEDALLLKLMDYIYILMLQTFFKENSQIFCDLSSWNSQDQEVYNYVYRLIKDVNIYNKDDIDYYFDFENLKKLIKTQQKC